MDIRCATPADIPQIVDLCREHAVYERAEFNPEGKASLLSGYLFGPHEVLKCLVAECNDSLVGYATFMKQFSTWDAAFYLYLDCLFLKEEVRGKGAGRQLMNKVKEYALEENCKLIQWQTPDFNTGAIQFYQKLGAVSKTKERFFWQV